MKNYVKQYLSLGWNIIPVKGKKPIWKWQQYQERKIDPTLWQMMGSVDGVAVICGRISEGLVVLDFDDKVLFSKFIKRHPEAKNWPRAISGSRKGYHLFIRVDNPPRKMNLKPEGGGKGIDVLAEGSYAVLPPSTHPSGKRYAWVSDVPKTTEDIPKLSEEEFKAILDEIYDILGIEPPKTPEERPPETNGKQVMQAKNKIDFKLDDFINLITPLWKEGQRQDVALALSGWLRKRGYTEEAVKWLISQIVNATGDTEHQQRLSAVTETFKKDSNDELIGISKLKEIAQATLGTTKAEKWLKKLTETVKPRIPTSGMDYKLIGFVRNQFIYIDFKECRIDIVKINDKTGNLDIIGTVLWGYPVEVTEFYDFTSQERNFKVVWHMKDREDIEIEGDANRIVNTLSRLFLTADDKMAKKVLATIIQQGVREGNVKFIETTSRPGWYRHRGKIIFVPHDRWRDEWTEEEIREHLERLNRIITEAFQHIPEKAATVIKWFAFAPFAHIYKNQKNIVERFKYLYLYGKSFSGKSTLARLGLSLWGVQKKSSNEISGGAIDTTARIGDALGSGTFPVVVNEVDNLWKNQQKKQHVIDIIKDSVDSNIARKKLTPDGRVIIIPALAALCLTANSHLPNDTALINRFVSIEFKKADEIDKEYAREFNETDYYCPAAGWAIGQEIISMLENGEWEGKSWDEIAMFAIERAFKKYTKIMPVWNMPGYHEDFIDADENTTSRLAQWMLKVINNEFNRHMRPLGYDGTAGVISLNEKIKALSDGNIIPWLKVTRNLSVFIIPDLMFNDIPEQLKSEFIGSKDILKEYLMGAINGMTYQPRRIKEGGKYISRRVLTCNMTEFVEWLSGGIIDDDDGEDSNVANTEGVPINDYIDL